MNSMNTHAGRGIVLALLAVSPGCMSYQSSSCELERASIDAERLPGSTAAENPNGDAAIASTRSESASSHEASLRRANGQPSRDAGEARSNGPGSRDASDTRSSDQGSLEASDARSASESSGPRVIESTLDGSPMLAPLAVATPAQFVVRVVDYDRLFVKPGVYLTASVTGSQQLGDLDGQSILFGPALVFLPSMDPGVGFDVGMGFRTFEDAFQITYNQSDHSGSFQNGSLDSTEHLVNFDWKHFFLIDRRWQPYTLLGFNIPWLDIDDGAQKGIKVGDATLYGFGMNLGGGAAYYLTPQLSISLQATMTLIDYFEVSALGHDGTINGDVFTEGWRLALGTAYTF